METRKKKTHSTNMFRCEVCNKSFTSKVGFQLHSQRHTGQYSYFCGLCSKGFSAKGHYEDHKRAHEGRGYACDYCGKVFKSALGLKRHRSEHTGEYSFSCKLCNKGYNVKKDYMRHMESHK